MAECNSTQKNIEAGNELKLLMENIIECILNERSGDSSKEVTQLIEVICSMKERAAVAKILSYLLSVYDSAKDIKIENVDSTNSMDWLKHKNLDSLNVKREIPNSTSSNQNAEKPRGSELEKSHNFTGNKGQIYLGCTTVSHANGPDVLKCQTEIDNLKFSNDKLEKEICELQETLRCKGTEISKKERKLEEKFAEIDKLKKDIVDLNKSLDDKTREVLNIGKENENLKVNSAAKSQEADTVKVENNELKRSLSSNKVKLDAKEKHIENFEAEKLKYEETINDLEKKLISESKENTKLESKLNNKNKEIEDLKNQISESRFKSGVQETQNL